jgi:hypothetical protein
VPVETFKAVPHPGREILNARKHQDQFSFNLGGLLRGLPLRPELRQARLEAGNARLEFGAVDDAGRERVDQPIDAALERRDLAPEPKHLFRRGGRILGCVQPAAVFRCHPIRSLQNGTNPLPHGLFEAVGADRPVVADGSAAEAVAVSADAAVVAVLAPRPIHLRPGRRLAVVGVPAAAAHGQALQQPARSPQPVPLASAVLRELRLRGLEHGLVDECGHGHLDPLLTRHGNARRRARRRMRMATDRPQTRPGRQEARVPVDRPTDIGRVGRHAAYGRRVPARLPPPGLTAGPGQAAADLAQAQPLQGDPGEDLSHHMRLLLGDVKTRHPTTLRPRHIAKAVRGGGEGAERARARRMPAAPTAALEDLGPLVFRDHPLHLQQEVVLGRAADRAIEKDHLGGGAAKFLNQQHLVRVAARQAVGRMDVKASNETRRDRVFSPHVLVVSPRLQARTARELVALLQADPGRYNLATAGIGSGVHVAAELFRSITQVQVEPVHYRGGGPSVAALVAGEAQVGTPTMASSIGQIRGGGLRALAVLAERRSPALPDVPSAPEAGLPGLIHEEFFPILAPAGTPAPVMAGLGAAFRGAIQQNGAKLIELAGVAPRAGFETSEQVMDLVREGVERYTAILRAAGVQPE